jgi:hypothetical protein
MLVEKLFSFLPQTSSWIYIPNVTGWNLLPSNYRTQVLLDNETGQTKTFNIQWFPSRDIIYRRGRVNLPAIFDISDTFFIIKIEYYHGDLAGTSHCINFTLPKNGYLNVNVTMLSPIVNYTFGRPEFIEENYTTGNSVIAKIKSYPCCGIKNVSLQIAQICSK